MKKQNVTCFILVCIFIFIIKIDLFANEPNIEPVKLNFTANIVLDSATNAKLLKKAMDSTKIEAKTIDCNCTTYDSKKNTNLILWIFRILAAAVLSLAIYLCFWQYMLKDIVSKIPAKNTKALETKQYSLSRCIGIWWTMIIVICLILGSSQNHGIMISVNSTCLILIGIGAGTTVLGNFIDKNDFNNYTKKIQLERHQDREIRRDFLWDLLNDGANNYSVHRFQTLVFNLIFGVVFAIEFYDNLQKFISNSLDSCNLFPEFSTTTLGMLGISSSIYLTVKNTENKSGNNISNFTADNLKARAAEKMKEILPK